MKIYPPIISFFDRNYNLLFHRRMCFKMLLDAGDYVPYNGIIMFADGVHARYLGRSWYKVRGYYINSNK